MKKIILIMLLALVVTNSLEARAPYGTKADLDEFLNMEKKFYFSYSKAATISGDEKYLYEPMTNIVGANSVREEYKIGWIAPGKGQGTNYNNVAIFAPFLYYYKYDENKNNEKGYGLGVQVFSKLFRPPLLQNYINHGFRISFLASAGLGEQKVNGQTFSTDTNSDPIKFIFDGLTDSGQDGIDYGDFKAVYVKDTSVFEINIALGIAYQITDYIFIQTEARMNTGYYSFSYAVEGNSVYSTGAGSEVTTFYQSNFSINFMF